MYRQINTKNKTKIIIKKTAANFNPTSITCIIIKYVLKGINLIDNGKTKKLSR